VLRLLTATVVAPFLVTLLAALPGIGGDRFESAMFSPLVQPAFTVMMIVPIILALFAVGWWHQKLQWYWAAAAGTLVGILLFGPMFWPTLADDNLRDWKRLDTLATLSGFVGYTAAIFLVAWVLGIWRNPRFQGEGSRSRDSA
jgi:sugar phosphate permease